MLIKLLLLITLSSVPFLFSLDGDFVFDDSEAIIKNKDVTESSGNVFINDFWGTNIKNNLSHKSYRPLTILSFRFNYAFDNYTFNAYHFKVTNLICHVICSVLVWWSYTKIIKISSPSNNKQMIDLAFLAASLFSVHPIHTEAVSGIVGRADVLAGITFFVSFLFFHSAIRYDQVKQIIWSWFCLFTTLIFAAISMLFKENGITVLGLCVIYEAISNRNIDFISKNVFSCERKTSRHKPLPNEIKHSIKKSLIRISILLLTTVLLLYARWTIMGCTKPHFKPIDNPAAFSKNKFAKIATYNYIYFLNLLLLIWPQWLCFDWSMGCVPLIENISDLRIISILSLFIYGIMAGYYLLVIKSNKRLKLMAFAMLIIPYLPASNIFFTVGFVLAERILYIPSAGYCLLLTIGLHDICKEKPSKHKMMTCMFTFLLLIYALKSWQRSLNWRNEYDLFTAGLAVCPLNAKVHYNVAKVADARNNTDWALFEYREAIRLNPQYYQAMNNLANLLKNQRNYDEAEHHLKTAIALKRDFPAAWMNLGIVLASTGRYSNAEIAYKTAIEYRKKYPDCYYNLGNMYLDMNNKESAVEAWQQAINFNPQHVLAWTNLLALLDNTGQNNYALNVIPNALAVLPKAPSIHFVAANIYGKLEMYKNAEEHFSRAIELFGNRVQAIHYANFGVLYHRWKKYDMALHMYKKALKIDPSFKSALNNIHMVEKILIRD